MNPHIPSTLTHLVLKSMDQSVTVDTTTISTVAIISTVFAHNLGDLSQITIGGRMSSAAVLYDTKKAFIEAVKQLPKSDTKLKDNHNDSSTQFVFVSPQDQKCLNDMTKFLNLLQTFKTEQFMIKKNNKSNVYKNIQILKTNANKIKTAIDDIVNSIERKFLSSIENEEKTFDLLDKKINESIDNTNKLNKNFKICLQNENNNNSNNNINNSNNDKTTVYKNFCRRKRNEKVLKQ